MNRWYLAEKTHYIVYGVYVRISAQSISRVVNMVKKKLKGLYAAPALPFNEDLSINENLYAGFLETFTKVRGVGGIVVNGHAGEVATLEREERKRNIEIASSIIPKGIDLVAGIEGLSTKGILNGIQDAEQAGADCALILPPFDYFPRKGMVLGSEGPLHFFKEISQSSGIPLILFQYPKFSGTSYTTETLLKIADLDAVIGIKNAVWDVEAYTEQYYALKDKVSVLAACDSPELMGMMFVGADGALIGISNVATEKWANFVSNSTKGNYNQARDSFVSELIPIMRYIFGNIGQSGPSFISKTKEALRQLGIFQISKVRPPELDVREEDKDLISRGLKLAKLL